MADGIPSDEEFATWYMPVQALRLIATIIEAENTAKTTIIGRLRGGMIRAASRGVAYELSGSRTESKASIVLMNPESWACYDQLTHGKGFWLTADFEISPRSSQPSTLLYYGVRFDRVGVDAFLHGLLGEDRQIPSVASHKAIKQLTESPTSKGLRVSDPLLQAWYELYQRAYQGTAQDTLANAWESAKGMFPGKSVARDRVHALCGGRKTGKKSVQKPE